VAYDIDYIENWSLALDIRILLATVVVGFVHRNAY
jgi:lipopolysaccharide/colanic/teichoic acid biosynthesis glycosyltransferase